MVIKYKNAIENYSQAININPKNEAYYFYRSSSYGELQQYEKSFEDSNKAISLNPKFAEAYNTFLEDSVSPEETENFTFTDDNRGIDKSIEYPEASLVEKVTVDALRAASIDSVEKLYTANNMKYNGESIADFLNALKINDSYTGIDYEIIPGVSLSFTEEV